MDYSPPSSSVHGILQARMRIELPFPPPGDLPAPGIKPGSPALQAYSLPSQGSCGFPGDSHGKEYACNAEDMGLIPGLRRFPGEENGNSNPVFLPEEFHGQRTGGLQSMESQRVGHD